MRGLMVGLVVLARPASAEDDVWTKLMREAEDLAALDDRYLKYGAGQQWFYVSGKTLYDSGRPSWGNW